MSKTKTFIVCSPITSRTFFSGLLGSLLCFPKSSLPKPVLQPSEPTVELMECPDIQEHILNVVLRCARRETTSKARCIAIASLGQWILQNLTNPNFATKTTSPTVTNRTKNQPTANSTTSVINPRLKEAIQVILQALQFKHRTIARVAAETLKLCAEKGKEISRIERLPYLIINSLIIALEIQNVQHPKDSDKIVITSLLLCLGEFCMATPISLLIYSDPNSGVPPLIYAVLRILHQIATGAHADRIKLFTADEDFDMTITVDDVKTSRSASGASYQTTETTLNCIAAVRLCAKTVAMHLVTHIGHFPMGIGASRLSSIVDENDDMVGPHPTDSISAKDSMGLASSHGLLNASNMQMFLLNPGIVASFIELPSLKLPGGGVTAGLVTATRQVRVLLRDINGKSCWDVSILYKEPTIQFNEEKSKSTERQHFFNEKSSLTFHSKTFQSGRGFSIGAASLDPMTSTVGMPVNPLRHTMRHRPPTQLPVAKDVAPDLDQLDDVSGKVYFRDKFFSLIAIVVHSFFNTLATRHLNVSVHLVHYYTLPLRHPSVHN